MGDGDGNPTVLLDHFHLEPGRGSFVPLPLSSVCCYANDADCLVLLAVFTRSLFVLSHKAASLRVPFSAMMGHTTPPTDNDTHKQCTASMMVPFPLHIYTYMYIPCLKKERYSLNAHSTLSLVPTGATPHTIRFKNLIHATSIHDCSIYSWPHPC
jgi:hypothetical protein